MLVSQNKSELTTILAIYDKQEVVSRLETMAK